MIRIAIADDHPLLRQGIERLIDQQPDMRLIGEVADGRRALQLVETQEIDVLILDLSLPRLSGHEVLRRLRKEHPAVAVVVLSMYPADQYEARMIEQGANAYITKDAPPEQLLQAIRLAASSGTSASLDAVAQPSPRRATRPHQTLTAREYQIFTLIFQGQPVTEIAAELDLSSSTVSNHIAKIREKLGVRSIGEIVRYAHDAGLISSPARKR